MSTDEMKWAIERLKNDRNDEIERVKRLSVILGRIWAMRKASFVALERVAQLEPAELLRGSKDQADLTSAAFVAQLGIIPGHTELEDAMSAEELGLDTLSSFYDVEEVIVCEVLTPRFVAGFVSGVRSVWLEAERHILNT